MHLIERPDTVFGLIITFIPVIIGAGITITYFGKGGTKNIGMIPLISCVFFVGLSMFYFGSLMDDYKTKVETLIHETECKELPSVASQYEKFKSDVIDEIVLRCLINQDNQELTLFVRDARS